jgi:hypothetical protein
MKIFLILISVIFFGCSKGAKTPEGLIQLFVQDISSKKLDLSYFEKYTTGEMWQEIQEAGVEEYEKKSRMLNISSVKVSILNKNCQKTSCALTYSVSFKTKDKVEGEFASEVRKIAQVEQVDEYWKISKITNLKTFHESGQAINPLVEDKPE